MRRELVATRAAARRAIDSGLVVVDGVADPKAATLVDAGAVVRLVAAPDRFVSRGGEKLDAALERFEIDVAGRTAIDVGAATGGFTDCLLQRGAAAVTSVDVGYGQLDWKLRKDARVEVVERTNIRTADPSEFGVPFDVVVCDISFIGIQLVVAQLAALGGPDSDWVLLVKPQFEAGKDAVGPGGVVTDPLKRLEAVTGVIAGFEQQGIGLNGIMVSPLRGAKSGNLEYLTWFRRGLTSVSQEAVREEVLADG